MAADLKSLLILVTFFMFLNRFALPQEQNQFIFNGFKGANLHLNGIAKILPNGLLELTNTSNIQVGRAFFPFPLKFNKSSSNSSDSLSFSTNFVFAMVPELANPGGHGIAFTISPTMELAGAVASQYFGLFNSSSTGLSANHVFAIELDTIQSPEFGDMEGSHVGIDVNNLRSLKSAPATYFTEGITKSLDFLSGSPMQLWIDYDEVEKLLNVTLAPVGSNKPSQPLLSTSIDLSTVLLDSMYVGFSSSTGELASDHYILGWSFRKFGKAQSLDYSKLPSLPPRRKPKSKADLIIILPSVAVIAMLVAISGGAYVIRRKKYEEIREDWEKEYGPQRLGDFGLAKLYDHGTNPQTTCVVGTLGYMAPELARTGKATTSTDVFAFGTFMLEIACGRKPLELQLDPEGTILADWVLQLWKAGAILDASDHRLEGEYVAEEMELVLRLGLLCTNPRASNRPSMRQLVQYLDGNVTLPEIPLDGARIEMM
ncbi:hypothetical protein POUND7_009104 [Theobroma cacao]